MIKDKLIKDFEEFKQTNNIYSEFSKLVKEVENDKQLNDLKQKQKELQLTFEESAHKYTMVDVDGNLHSNWPSVSKVLKKFSSLTITTEDGDTKIIKDSIK